MTLLPFADCCLWLGVDPKTLRLWLKAANLSCCLHPTDARLKCLTPSQLQHLADLHGRCLPHPLPGTSEDVASCSSASSLNVQAPPLLGLRFLCWLLMPICATRSRACKLRSPRSHSRWLNSR